MLTLHRSRDLLAERVVLQPYGLRHSPLVRAAIVGAGLMLGVLGASWLLVAGREDTGGLRAENEVLRERLELTARELEAERHRAEELARERDALARDAKRAVPDVVASPQKAAKRRERRAEGEEPAEAARSAPTAAPQATVPQAAAAPAGETASGPPRAE